MIIEYLVMKLALQAVVDECNRMALVQESQERVGFLRSGIARLEVAYESGLIDVIDERDGLRVIVLLPGIRSKDVKVGVRDRLLRIEITKGGTTYSREIPCKLAPSDIKIKSVVEKNSVVEILFSKVRKARSNE